MSELTPDQAIEILKRAAAEGAPILSDCASVIQKLQKRDEQWCDKWKAAVDVNGNNCGELVTLRQKAETYRLVLQSISFDRCRCNPLENPCAGCLAKQILANVP